MNKTKIKINALKNKYFLTGSLTASHFVRFVKAAFWSFAGAIISRGLNLISSIVVARLLGTVGYGELGIIQSTVGMFGVFTGLGLGMTATKYVAEFREKDPQKAGRIIALVFITAFISGGIVSIILVILSPWLASRTLSAPHLSGLLQLSAGLLFFSAINGAQTGALAGFEAFKTIAIVNFLSGTISFPLIVAGVWFFQLKGAVLALVGSMVVNYFLNRIAIKKECERYSIRPDFQNSIQEISVLWKFSIPAFLSSAMVGPVTWLCNVMLVNQINGYSEMGIFNAANLWRNLLLFLQGIFLNVSLPIMVSLNENGKSRDFEKFAGLIQNISIITVLPLVSLMILFSKLLMGLYGESFIQGSPVLKWLLSSVAIGSAGAATGSIIQAKGKMWLGLAFNLSWGLILIICVRLFVEQWKATALSFAFFISYLFLSIWGLLYLKIKNDISKATLKKAFLAMMIVIIITLISFLFP